MSPEPTQPVFNTDPATATQLDARDPLAAYRRRFHLPRQADGTPFIYFCGNSLGLQPVTTRAYLEQELHDWEHLGVEGHFHAQHPWMPYHEFLAEAMGQVVGAKPQEVVVMNTLTVNLHLLMVSFYRPTPGRYKILIESDAFPSDRYAVESQLRFHGYDPAEALLELTPRPGEVLIRKEDIAAMLAEQGAQIALLMIGGVNYYTGQYFDLKGITELGHRYGCTVGFDCAHGAGNVPLNLHDSGADFAVWCTYKYLNAGPGSVAGCFVHERHAETFDGPRFAGWWGHNKTTRFNMRQPFDPMPGAEGWQLSNPPILSLAAIRASLDIFAEAGMDQLRAKSLLLTGYLEYLLQQIPTDRIRVITPRDPEERGCQLSIQVRDSDKTLYDELTRKGLLADWREPDVIRVAPVPLYNSFGDVYRFYELLHQSLA
ncbi:MAG: kynureninase [Lewinella sp.]|nr:kynureninase [Lewinella sp.]